MCRHAAAAGSHAADLRFVWSAVEAMTPHPADGSVVAGKSTVPVGTAAAIAAHLERAAGPDKALTVVWNPEFLRGGFAVADTLHPDRIVIGAPAGPKGEAAVAVMREVYAAAIAEAVPFLTTDLPTSSW